jgi:transcriptional regulator with XRE-family HTH domain
VKNTSSGKTPEKVVTLLRGAVSQKGQSAVARESGIALYSVQRYLKGIGVPTEATLNKLAVYFGVNIWELRGDVYFFNDESGRSELNSYDKELSLAVLEPIEITLVSTLETLINSDQEISDLLYDHALYTACGMVFISNSLSSFLHPEHLSEVQTLAKAVIKTLIEHKENKALELKTKEIIDQILSSYSPPYPKLPNHVQKWAEKETPAIIDSGLWYLQHKKKEFNKRSQRFEREN